VPEEFLQPYSVSIGGVGEVMGCAGMMFSIVW
jgi:hypothetical protein